MAKSPYDTDLDRNPANLQPLTPLGFLERAAAVFPAHTAIIHGPLKRSYAEFYARARGGWPRRLPKRGIRRGDTRLGRCAPTRRRCSNAITACRWPGRAQHAQHPARRRDHRLLARPRRSQGGDHRPRVFQGDEGGAGAVQSQAAGDRLRRSGVQRPGRAARRDRIRGRSSPAAIPISPGRCPTTNGTRSRSTTPRAPPAIRRAWSITTAARICSRWATSSPAACGSIRSICGRCRCSTATAGASPGRCRSSPARMSACARCAPARCSTPSPTTK